LEKKKEGRIPKKKPCPIWEKIGNPNKTPKDASWLPKSPGLGPLREKTLWGLGGAQKEKKAPKHPLLGPWEYSF